MNDRTARVARPIALALGLAVGVASVAACGDDTTTADGDAPAEGAAGPVIDPGDGGDYHPEIDPADFVAAIDNPYLPLVPGSRWVYEGTDDGETERIEVEVTNDHRQVMGVSTTVVRDTVYVDGELAEDTFDWYAQDRDGNVWYLGEDTTEYENGEVSSTEGSWEAGVDRALPGIIMQAQPTVGDAYRQEYYAGEAEDLAKVTAAATPPRASPSATRQAAGHPGMEPARARGHRGQYFAPGVGTVLEVKTAGGEGRIELIEFTPAPAQG